MKYSEAMLKGFEMVGGKQCKRRFHTGAADEPASVCVLGAVSLGLHGSANGFCVPFQNRFMYAWGVDPSVLNDNGVDWRDIYGMAVAAGL